MRMPAVSGAGGAFVERPTRLSARGLAGSRREEPEALEVGEVCVDGRGRRESYGRADLAHGRRVAVLCGVVVDEREDLALARCELRGGGFGMRTHVRRVDPGADVVKGGTRREGSASMGTYALVAELVDALG